MREGISIEVSAADRDRLERIVADGNSRQKHVRRARIILAMVEGCGTVEIMSPEKALAVPPRPGTRLGRPHACGPAILPVQAGAGSPCFANEPPTVREWPRNSATSSSPWFVTAMS